MNEQQKIDFKIALKKRCVEILEQRINASYNSMQNAQAAANEEDKSSAGDKYETGRAMNHLEKDMYARQLAANKSDMASLMSINCEQVYNAVTPGCFVKCADTSFFIAAGLGKIIIEQETIFLLSYHAPLARILCSKKIGDTISFNGRELIIEELY